jgi:hypothetical protein
MEPLDSVHLVKRGFCLSRLGWPDNSPSSLQLVGESFRVQEGSVPLPVI